MLPEYDFDYRKAKPNRFAGRIGSERVVGKPNQRPGSVSNSQVGADFECAPMDCGSECSKGQNDDLE